MFNACVASLRRHSKVEVYINTGLAYATNVILIRHMKMQIISRNYGYVANVMSRYWLHLPPPLDDNKVFIFIWLTAAEGHGVNDSTISLRDSGTNTHRAHVVDHMDRIRYNPRRRL